MSDVEDIFDINKILRKSFVGIESLSKDKNIELIFEMSPTLPRELRGDVQEIEDFLTIMLTFVFKYTQNTEIVLTLNAPEDFIYEELVSFKIEQSGVSKEKVLLFLETELVHSLKKLDGKVVYDENDIHLSIPLIIGELGFRRHYRLPSKSMLQKKVLLIAESENSTRCITKMFKYFPYDVDLGFHEYVDDNSSLSSYDLVVVEESLATDSFTVMVEKVQKVKNLKYVILTNSSSSVISGHASISTHLLRPVTQESIFELIISLFGDDKFDKESDAMTASVDRRSDQRKNNIGTIGVNKIIEEKKSVAELVLDIEEGLKNAKEQGFLYTDELQHFLGTFDKSDLYFREIVNEKQNNKIKEFCIDLEKQSKRIGAGGMQKFADIISLIYIYDKLDMLPIYPGRYHIELDKLTVEIKKYLHIK